MAEKDDDCPMVEMPPERVAEQAQAQFNGNFSAGSDALTALALIYALAKEVDRLRGLVVPLE